MQIQVMRPIANVHYTRHKLLPTTTQQITNYTLNSYRVFKLLQVLFIDSSEKNKFCGVKQNEFRNS